MRCDVRGSLQVVVRMPVYLWHCAAQDVISGRTSHDDDDGVQNGRGLNGVRRTTSTVLR